MRILAGLICLGLCPAAIAAPPNLLNKSVRVSSTVSIPAKGPDGTITPHVKDNTIVLYISSAGRVFNRIGEAAGRHSRTHESAPGQNTYRFEGNKLVGVRTYAGGAGQIIITFDSAGQSCNATFMSGHEAGRALRFRGMNGVVYEATGPASFSNVSCSIASGNAFAQ